MAKAARVHHWKHGWIPLDATARAQVSRKEGRAATLDAPPVSDGLDAWPESKPLDGLPKKTRRSTMRDDVLSANAGYDQGPEYRVNCTHCVNAYELRRRGYDVTATPLPKEYFRDNGRSARAILSGDWMPEDGGMADFQSVSPAGAKNIASTWPYGARGWVSVNWRGGLGGHIFAVEKTADGVQFVDPQSGKTDVADYFDRTVGPVMIARVDNLTPTDAVKEFVTEPTSQQRMILARRLADRSR